MKLVVNGVEFYNVKSISMEPVGTLGGLEITIFYVFPTWTPDKIVIFELQSIAITPVFD